MNNILNVIFLGAIAVSSYMLAKKIGSYVKSLTNVEGYRIYQHAYSLMLSSLCLAGAYYSTHTYFYSFTAGLCFGCVIFSYLIDKSFDRKSVELYCEFQKLLSKLDDSGFQHTQKAYELRDIMGRIMSELPKKYQEEIIEREKEVDKEKNV